MSRAATEYRYEKLTWPEINDAVDLGKVCIVPCGAVEQHGPHLPLDVDLICPTEIARGAGRQVPEQSAADKVGQQQREEEDADQDLDHPPTTPPLAQGAEDEDAAGFNRHPQRAKRGRDHYGL